MESHIPESDLRPPDHDPHPEIAEVHDVDRWAQLEELHGPLVRSLTLYCGDPGVAEEIAQDALVRVMERWSTLRDKEARVAWALRIGFNLASSRYRRRAAESRALHRAGPQPTSSDDPAAGTGLRLAVRDALGLLPPRQRAAIVCRYLLDLSVEQTALAMRCRPGTVKAHCSQAIESLSVTLGEQFVPESENPDA